VTSAETIFGSFDPAELFDCLGSRNTNYSKYVNPLMTSMQCLDRGLFGENFSVKGQDLLDADPTKNPDFFGHNHVLIPYCSSDIWLSSDIDGNDRECNCSDLDCFSYEPSNPRLQFAFRGKIIFESIFQQLMDDFGMNVASEIIFGGSSAGGLGVVNLAKSVSMAKPPSAELLVIVDSSWFVDFQDGILKIFDGTTQPNPDQPRSSDSVEVENSLRLFKILQNHSSCSDLELGYPCCVSPHCVMTARDNVTGEYMGRGGEGRGGEGAFAITGNIGNAFL
jgi:hypothetical protein